MKNALLALDSTSCAGRPFEELNKVIGLFQKHDVLPSDVGVASIYHPNLTPAPIEYFDEEKKRLAREAKATIENALRGKMGFRSIDVLISDSSSAEDHVEQLSRFARRKGADLLVLGSSDRTGLPYWFLGSFSETAALYASVPVLIIKSSSTKMKWARDPKFVLAVDVAAPPSARDIRWIAERVKSARATLELIYITPKRRFFLDKLQLRKSRSETVKTLQALAQQFKARGVHARSTVRDEGTSIAHSIRDFADELGAWMIMTITAERTRARKLLLGSKARRLLGLSERPLVSIRQE